MLNLTQRSIDTLTTRSANEMSSTPSKQKSASKSPKKGVKSPKVREGPGQSENMLLSPSSRQNKASNPPALPRTTRAAPTSPYKPFPPKAVVPASNTPASPRAYLEGLKPDNLANGILRDQTAANAAHYPTAWIVQVQDSLKEPVSKLRKMMQAHLGPEGDVGHFYPAAGGDEDFDWTPFRTLCDILWPVLSGTVLSLKTLPAPTLALLAEFRAELTRLPAFLALEPNARNKAVSDALFNLLIWNGVIGPMVNAVPPAYQRLAHGFGAYVKAAWGMQAQSQGNISSRIASFVQEVRLKQCSAFRELLTEETERIARLITVRFQDDHGNHSLNALREKNIDRHFTNTWEDRNDDYARVVELGDYSLVDDNGIKTRCSSYSELKAFVGTGARKSLPEVVLHVAGERIQNFLCNTYLYKIGSPLFTDVQGRRVEPVPSLRTQFSLRRDNDNGGRITVHFSAIDPEVRSVMLIESNGNEDLEFEAPPYFPASLAFHGTFHFHQNEEFEAGFIEVNGQNFHLLTVRER
ncbi:MAG: hypothetical protein JWP93_1550 [Polaromonas sp.]|nr:hypothetical protein [Polaromonas sp.]